MTRSFLSLHHHHHQQQTSSIAPKTILVGNVLDRIKEFPDEYFDCILFSPPYYNDVVYHTKKEWGKEKTVYEYLSKMRKLQNQLYRVLKSCGTMFVNIGDSYAKRTDGYIVQGSEYGVPERFAIQCIDDGWLKENTITWLKRNAMPTSSKKNFWRNTESVYFMTKSKKHYLNKNAVFVPRNTTTSKSFNRRVRDAKSGNLQKRYGKNQRFSENEMVNSNEFGIKKQDNRQRSDYTDFNNRWDENKTTTHRDPGTVLDITIKRNADFHFAAFPVDFAEWFLKCGVPSGGKVLDPFMGSGTTAIAAENLGLSWNGIELKRDYAQKAIKRIGEGSVILV